MVKSIRNVSILTLILLLSAVVASAGWTPKVYTSESSAVINSIPYKQAKGSDKELVKQLLPV